jgi:hypothetical protein
MPKVKKLNEAVPNGYAFVWAATGFDLQKAMPHRSHRDCVLALQAHVRGNQHVAAQSGMPSDYDSLSNLVSEYTAKQLLRQGYTAFVTEEASAASPKPIPQHPLRPKPLGVAAVNTAMTPAKSAVVGLALYRDWLGDGGKPVASGTAERRGLICATCPNNQPGDWKTFFTERAAALILRTLELKNDMELVTSVDQELGLCRKCLCPLKSKVWVPLPHVQAHTSASVLADLPDFCWIKQEIQEPA